MTRSCMSSVMAASDYFSVHSHSEWSVLDGMGTVEQMVAKVSKLGQPALALTDHGTMAGSIRLYKECMKAGIAPFPGSEFYVVKDVTDPDTKDQRFHLGMLALDYEGYRALIRLSSLSHQRDRFYRKPLIDLGDLAFLYEEGLSKHIAVTTGCYFGLVVQQLVTNGASAARSMIEMLRRWFPHLYVEVQFHGIHTADQEDGIIASNLLDLAHDLSLPVVLGQDSHYCNASDQPVHDLMKDICYFGDGEDNRFPGGPYDLAPVSRLKEPWHANQWDRIEEGHADLLDKHALRMPALDTYKFHVPEVSRFPLQQLKRKLETGAGHRNLIIDDTWSPNPYKSRVEYELRVITTMGMENYFLLIEDIVDWCRRNGVLINARGSANGSLVCYLLGITEVDPLVWNTDFDRFLSLDRKKPPDIDLDVESSRRGELLAYVKHRHPKMVQIGTYNRLGVTEEEDADGYGKDKGSAVVQYMAAKRKKLGDKFDGKIAPTDRKALNALSDMKVRRSIGVHAAGVVLPSDDLPVDAYLATALVASSGTTVTQMVMEDVEEAGYVKGDFLGLKQLETLNGALVNIGKKPNDWSWVPWDDPAACKELRSGNCAGIFQFGGYATTVGGKEMGVRSTQDAIICLALYRPALMNGGQKDLYLANRKARKRQDQVRLHKTFDPILDVTAGVPVFQEQVMQMCKHIGMRYDDWNDLMKAVKASNDKIGQYAEGIFDRVKPIFLTLCVKQGMTKAEAQQAWDSVVGFTDYGFNRAHATGYGITAYRSAYLKAHYPLEFMQSLLTVWAGTTSEPVYIREARRMGIAIARVDVNRSDIGWTIDTTKKKPTLRKGFRTLDGIGPAVAECLIENRPAGGWKDLQHLIDTCPARPVSGGKNYKKDGTLNGVLKKLADAGALSSLGV